MKIKLVINKYNINLRVDDLWVVVLVVCYYPRSQLYYNKNCNIIEII